MSSPCSLRGRRCEPVVSASSAVMGAKGRAASGSCGKGAQATPPPPQHRCFPALASQVGGPAPSSTAPRLPCPPREAIPGKARPPSHVAFLIYIIISSAVQTQAAAIGYKISPQNSYVCTKGA